MKAVTIETRRGEKFIVIRIPVEAFPDAMKQNPRDDSYYDVKVTDLSVFSKDVVRELVREEEDGTTPVHLLLDAALAAAVDNGSVGCEYKKKRSG